MGAPRLTPIRHLATLVAMKEGREYEVADMLGAAPQTVRNYIVAGVVPVLVERSCGLWIDVLRSIAEGNPLAPASSAAVAPPAPSREFRVRVTGEVPIEAVEGLLRGLGAAVEPLPPVSAQPSLCLVEAAE